MRPTEEVSEIISVLKPDWLVFEDAIPSEHINDLQSTQVLLKEFKSDIGDYGDSTFNSVVMAVTIQIFYGLKFAESMIFSEIEIMKSLENEGWRITSSEPHYLDISTNTENQQTIKNITVEKTVSISNLKGE